jgi:hypothetical protein
MKIIKAIIFISVVFFPNDVICMDTLKKPKFKILIIYSTGFKITEWKKEIPLINEKINIVSGATDKSNNIENIAKILYDKLISTRNIDLKMLKYEEAIDLKDILETDLLLLGTPTRFSNISWELKKFIDVTLYPIYVHKKNKLDKKFVSIFTTSDLKRHGKMCIKSTEISLKQYNPIFLNPLIIEKQQSDNEINIEIEQYLAKIEKVL